jgi:hypothetical protein
LALVKDSSKEQTFLPWATPAPGTKARHLPLTWFLLGSDHGDA